jgi:predicted secreted acid phosphatase
VSGPSNRTLTADLVRAGKERYMIIRKKPCGFGNEVRHQKGLRRCLAAFAFMLVAGLVPTIGSAAECASRQLSIPPAESIKTKEKPIADGFNIDTYKRQLTEYQKNGYISDIAAVMERATRYVLDRVSEVKRPAVVLDIDETSLSNWKNIEADDYGFIVEGSCTLQTKKACGFNEWIDLAIAPAIEPTLKFFDAIRADAISDKGVPNIAIFFITGRRESQRRATLWNLDRAGFKGWTGVATRPDDQHGSIVPFKSRERDEIVKKGYSIVANIGDQDSDLKDEEGKSSAECDFKLPNPFYFIP